MCNKPGYEVTIKIPTENDSLLVSYSSISGRLTTIQNTLLIQHMVIGKTIYGIELQGYVLIQSQTMVAF